jgi:hypothetical protein
MKRSSGGDDCDGVEFATRKTTRDDRFQTFDGVTCEQLQNPDVVPRADARATPRGERRAEFHECGRQLPVAVHRRVIERGGLLFQSAQEVEWVEYLLCGLVRAWVRSDHGAVADDIDTINVALHADGAERPPSRGTVAVAIELYRLVLVHLGRLNDARIKRMLGER